jgi:hypothetical protein
MNNKQEQIIKELRKEAKRLKHSPKRRDVAWLAKKCYKHFDSFNNAKIAAGLEIKNKQITSFPKNAFRLDSNLVILVAFLTSDGHLYKDLKGFYFSSKDKDFLKILEQIVDGKFGLKGKYLKGSGFGESYKYLVFNKTISLFLNNSGVPAGDKMLIPFDVPDWIKENKKFSKEYLKIIFYCEGSKYRQSKNTETIKINFNKSLKLEKDVIRFLNSLKKMLLKFGIETTNIWSSKGIIRKKDGVTTRLHAFKIKSSHVNKFINNVGWLK